MRHAKETIVGQGKFNALRGIGTRPNNGDKNWDRVEGRFYWEACNKRRPGRWHSINQALPCCCLQCPATISGIVFPELSHCRVDV